MEEGKLIWTLRDDRTYRANIGKGVPGGQSNICSIIQECSGLVRSYWIEIRIAQSSELCFHVGLSS